jgi:hypothetical protein
MIVSPIAVIAVLASAGAVVGYLLGTASGKAEVAKLKADVAAELPKIEAALKADVTKVDDVVKAAVAKVKALVAKL